MTLRRGPRVQVLGRVSVVLVPPSWLIWTIARAVEVEAAQGLAGQAAGAAVDDQVGGVHGQGRAVGQQVGRGGPGGVEIETQVGVPRRCVPGALSRPVVEERAAGVGRGPRDVQVECSPGRQAVVVAAVADAADRRRKPPPTASRSCGCRSRSRGRCPCSGVAVAGLKVKSPAQIWSLLVLRIAGRRWRGR